MSQDSLFQSPPTNDEKEIIHDFFIRTVNHKARSFKVRRCTLLTKYVYSLIYYNSRGAGELPIYLN